MLYIVLSMYLIFQGRDGKRKKYTKKLENVLVQIKRIKTGDMLINCSVFVHLNGDTAVALPA